MLDPNFSSGTIKRYANSFAIINPVQTVLKTLWRFGNGYTQWEFKRSNIGNSRQPKHHYYAKMMHGKFWLFHENCYNDFLLECQKDGVDLNTFIYADVPGYDTEEIKHIYTGYKTPRDNQPMFIDYLKNTTIKRKLIEARTGAGKTFMNAYSFSEYDTRITYIVKPKYIVKTINDLIEEFGLSKDDFFVIGGEDNEGSKELMRLIELGLEGKINKKFVIISLNVYTSYINTFVTFNAGIKDLGWKCSPLNFFKTIDSNLLIIDECHESFHAVFLVTLFSHVKNITYMSATLEDYDPFMKRMYEVFFPINTRIGKGTFDKYLKASIVSYNFKNIQYIKTAEYGGGTYSHTAFEKSILRNTAMRNNYAKFVKWCVDDHWIKLPNPKVILLYFATKSMIEFIMGKLKEYYPNLTIVKKTHGDPIKPVHNADIVLSTIGSLGTGHDIKNLKEVDIFLNIKSIKSVKQAWGRVRPQADGNHRLKLAYCPQFPKHIEFTNDNIKLLNMEAKTITNVNYDEFI